MGQILHKCAKTTHAMRAEIQQSAESIAKLAKKFSINPKTVAKWKHRKAVDDKPMGSHKLRTVLTPQDEEMICALRRKAALPLDDCYIALKDFIPKLSRSNLHRCLQRHGISVLPKEEVVKKRGKFKQYEIGYFHVDICQIRTGEGVCYLFVAVDRVSKFAFAEVYKTQTASNAGLFVQNLIKKVPYKIHKILTDNGAQFSYNLLPQKSKPKGKIHLFDSICAAHGIEHRTTKFHHPWTNGQVERMNRTLKEATIKRYHYDSQSQLEQHLQDFLNAYNFAKKLKTLNFKSPYEFIVEKYENNAKLFNNNPSRLSMGLYT